MANDKDIKINFKTSADTKGAKDAEDAIKKVAEAGKESGSKGAGFNPMVRDQAELDAHIEKTNQAADATAAHEAALRKGAQASAELEDKLSELKDQLEEVTEASEESSEGASELEKNVDSIGRAQKAQAVAQLVQGIGKISDKFREAASDVKEFDADAAKSFESTANRIDTVTNSVSALAMGFAAGGPIGAGVAGVGLLIGGLVNAWKESEVAAIKASASQRQALKEMTDSAISSAEAAADRAKELTDQRIEKTIQAQNDALEKGLKLIESQLDASRRLRREKESVLAAEDKLKLAEIDRSEALGKITKEEAEKRKLEVESGATKRKRQEEIATANEPVIQAENTAKLTSEMATKAEQDAIAEAAKVAEAKAKVEATKEEMLAQQNLTRSLKRSLGDRAETVPEYEEKARKESGGGSIEFKTQRDLDAEFRLGKDAINSNAEIQRETEAKYAREQMRLKEAEEAKAKLDKEANAKREAARQAQEFAQQKSQDAQGTISTINTRSGLEDKTLNTQLDATRIRDEKTKQETRLNEEAAIGKTASSIIPKETSNGLRNSVDRIREGLRDGDQGGEMAELIKLMQEIADVVTTKDKSYQNDLKDLKARVANMRDGK